MALCADPRATDGTPPWRPRSSAQGSAAPSVCKRRGGHPRGTLCKALWSCEPRRASSPSRAVLFAVERPHAPLALQGRSQPRVLKFGATLHSSDFSFREVSQMRGYWTTPLTTGHPIMEETPPRWPPGTLGKSPKTQKHQHKNSPRPQVSGTASVTLP